MGSMHAFAELRVWQNTVSVILEYNLRSSETHPDRHLSGRRNTLVRKYGRHLGAPWGYTGRDAV